MAARLLIAIPYYDHPGTLRDVVERSIKVHQEVLVVDDGSKVPAGDLLEGVDVHIERHRVNRGKGAAILTAGRYAEKRGVTHVVTLDADGQHDPADFPKFERAIRRDPTSLYVGCREFGVMGVPRSSRFGRKVSNFWFRLQTGQSVMDCQSGFRAYPVAVLTGLGYMCRGYAFEVEVLVRSAWAGLECRNVDISVYYPDKGRRISHFRKLRDNALLTVLNAHLTGRSVVPWPHRRLFLSRESGEKEDAEAGGVRALRYLRRMLGERASPGGLALATAIGVVCGALPLLVCHTLVIIVVCRAVRVNRTVAVGMSQVCMPPLVPALCIEVGYFIRNGRILAEFSVETLGSQAADRLWEWLLGAVILGPLLGAGAAGIVFLVARNMRRSAVVDGGGRWEGSSSV